MPPAEQRMYSTDETLKLISDKSKESDNFWIKVQRRAHPGAHPTIVATLSGANAQHFASPELWVPTLCGGGKFLLLAFHETDLQKNLGGAILFPVDGMDVRDVDLSIFDSSGEAKRSDWRGPARLEFPKASAPAVQQEMPMYGVRAPSAPGSGDSATINRQAWPRLAGGGGGVQREQYDDGGHFSSKAAGIEAERRVLEKEKLEAERQKHRDELEQIRRSHDSELKALESRFESKLAAITVAAKPTGPDPTMQVLMEMMKQQSEDRRLVVAQAAEDRRAAEARQQKADERFAMVLEKMAERKEKDPLEVLKAAADLIKPKNDDSAMMKTVHNMVEMQGTMMESAMNFVEHTSRLALGGEQGEEEPKWMKAAERLVRGVGKMATAAQVSRPQLPVPAQPMPQQVQTQPQPQARPAQQRPQQPPQTQMPVIDQIEAAIRQRFDVTQIAAALIKFYSDESIQKALEDAGGDFELLVQKRLGSWVNESPENGAYIKKLFEEVQRQVEAAGFVASDDEEGDDEGGEEDAQVDEGDDDNDE